MAKKLLLVSVAFFVGSITFLWADLTFAAISRDMNASGIADGGTFTTTAADTIVIIHYTVNGGAGTTPQAVAVDGTAATFLGAIIDGGNPSYYQQMYWAHVAAAGSHTLTAPNLNQNANVDALLGVDLLTPIDQFSNFTGPNASLSSLPAGSWVVGGKDSTHIRNNFATPITVHTAGDNAIGDTDGVDLAGSFSTVMDDGGSGLETEQFVSLNPAGATPPPPTPATSTAYIATKQEYLFVILIFTFFASIPFWDRVLTLRRDKYKV